MLMFGDFFQLHPTGDIAIMTNPENPDLGKDQVVSAFFWDCVEVDWGLQPWPACRAYVHELSQNIRSGGDKWWNQVLEQARIGALSEDNYNWMHGFPSKCIRHGSPQFWYEYRTSTDCPCSCPVDAPDDECQPCLQEKQRRCRVLTCREDHG